MTDAIRVSSPITGTDKTLSFEAGHLAQLADGAVVARIGDTMLLATVAAARNVREGVDFFPLTVDIEERAYAAGKIPGAFFRREGKPSDQASSTARCAPRSRRASATRSRSSAPSSAPTRRIRMTCLPSMPPLRP
jgi:polyribonucleotide nucleotidyltransferase